MTELLDYDRAVALLEEIVEEKGADYVYTTDPKTEERRIGRSDQFRCFYAHNDNSPGCIIGHLIHKLNPDFDLNLVERTGGIDALNRAGYSTGSIWSKTSDLILIAQSLQDRGEPWGNALVAAKGRAGTGETDGPR